MAYIIGIILALAATTIVWATIKFMKKEGK